MTKHNEALQTVLGYQQDVIKTEEHIVALQAAIAGQQERIQQTNSFTTNVPQLLEQRENLLADIVLKKKDCKELEQLDAAIAAAQKDLSKNTANAAKVVPDAKAAIAGLERQLVAAEAMLVKLQEQKTSVLYEFLLSEAEQIGVEYSEACVAITTLHRRLLAIDRIIRSSAHHEQWKTIMTAWGDLKLELPLFRLEACKGLGDSRRPGFAAKVHEAELTSLDSRVVDSMSERERDRITSLGVNL